MSTAVEGRRFVGGFTNPGQRHSVTSRRAIVAGSIGNAVEFVDWGIYATFSPFFADQFFPSHDRSAALLPALAVFAAGFIMRPIGGAVLGSFADRHGRMTGLTLSVLLMGGASLAIALCPTYRSIGIAAPGVLLSARLLQGFSNGGEFGASSAFLVEMAPPGRRAFFGSWQQVSVAASGLVVTGLGTALAFALSNDAMHAWGWRVAFGFGAVLGLAGFWLRTSVAETTLFVERAAVARSAVRGTRAANTLPRPLANMLTRHRGAALRVVGITMAGTMTYYVWITYMPAYAHLATGLSLPAALLANTIALAVFTCLLPFGGMLSDRIGRRATLGVFAAGFAIIAWPALHLIRNDFWSFLAIELVGIVLLVGYSANCAAVMAEQFPTEVRTVGIALPYALGTALFGGTAPYIVTWLVLHHAIGWTAAYVAAVSLISLIVYLTMPETQSGELS